MIIHCPECNARYTLTSQQIGEHGRTMRCAKCSQTWFQPPIEDDEGVDVGAPPLAPQVGASLGQIPETISPITLVVAVLSLLAIIAGGGIWWWTGNQTPVPQNYSPVTFTGAGETSDIHTDTGLILSEIERDVIEDNNVTILLFRGKVTNTNEVTTLVPEIRVQLL
ncbi:MAG: zinc-ribbon domain-containing protein, partial [Alphaproteobacteria bacterium]|nr:zinc-ribbon domain-containing protein [Alphaproteobacteria bacterium]